MLERVFGFIERRWGWFIVSGALIGGLVGGLVTVASPDVYVARSLVVLTDANIPPEEFADVARAMFPTDAVLRPVIRELGLDQTPGQLVGSETLSLEAQPGGLAVNVVARTKSPDLAVLMANATASQLVDVAEINGIGSLAGFIAEGPAPLQGDPLLPGILLGALVGAVIAGLDVAIVMLMRRRSLGADGRYRFESMTRVRVLSEDDGTTIAPAYPLSILLQTLGEQAAGSEVVAVVVDDGRDTWASLAVADELARVAKADGGVTSLRVAAPGEPIDGETQAGCLAVVAAAHTSSARLRELRRSLQEGSSVPAMALVLVDAPDGPD